MMQPATLITRNAAQDDLSAADYAEIFAELREHHSLSQLCALLDSQFSRAQWNKYERGETSLTRAMRNELRRGVGLPSLPVTVTNAVTTLADPNAAVWNIGDSPANHVVLVAAAEGVTINVNGSVQVVSVARVTSVTRALRPRRRYVRPCIPLSLLTRLSALQGVSWQDVIEAGLKTYETEKLP